MYAVKLEGLSGSANNLSLEAEIRPSSSGSRPDDRSTSTATALRSDAISVSAGNPRVEHLTGVVHLYRCLESEAGPQTQRPAEDGTLDSPTFSLPEERGPCLCVCALPLDLGVPDFCGFLGAHTERLQQIRFLRQQGAQSACLALLTFRTQESADEFYLTHNSIPFSSLEPDERCHLVFVKDVQISCSLSPAALPSPGHRELPTCPVCLERLDENASGIVTTVCNHEFHNECLQRWDDTSCPVCRYVANEAPSASRCSHCGTSQDLWICLICGHVGCGRYRERHAVDHWHDSEHAYALELESQRVWDYVSDGYVHRLVQSKTDGKLVEVPSPAQTSVRRHSHDRQHSAAQAECGEAGAGGSAADLSTKLDAITIEYNHLLVSQLDSQRAYFEGLLSKQAAAHESAIAEAQASMGETQASLQSQSGAVHVAEQARKAADKRAADALSKAQKVHKEAQDLRSLNEQVMRNQTALKQASDTARACTAAAEARIQDLEEQVRDLMIFIETQRTISESSELQAGSASIPAPAAPARKARSGKRR